LKNTLIVDSARKFFAVNNFFPRDNHVKMLPLKTNVFKRKLPKPYQKTLTVKDQNYTPKDTKIRKRTLFAQHFPVNKPNRASSAAT